MSASDRSFPFLRSSFLHVPLVVLEWVHPDRLLDILVVGVLVLLEVHLVLRMMDTCASFLETAALVHPSSSADPSPAGTLVVVQVSSEVVQALVVDLLDLVLVLDHPYSAATSCSVYHLASLGSY